MMRIMNALTDEPEWEKKVESLPNLLRWMSRYSLLQQVFQEESIAEWHKKALQLTSDLSPKMWEYIVQELRWKTSNWEDEPEVVAYDAGVVKSDEHDFRNLRDAVADLECETDKQKDYEPDSDGTVRYLIDPRLHPLIYGRSRILPPGKTTRKAIKEDEAAFLRYTGEGKMIPIPPAEEAHLEDDEWWFNLYGYRDLLLRDDNNAQRFPTPYSRKFQLLPCEVEFNRNGFLEPGIVSYINNLHPTRHRHLYGILSDIIFWVLLLWDKSLISRQGDEDRIPYRRVQYLPNPDCQQSSEEVEKWDGEDEEDEDGEEEWDEHGEEGEEAFDEEDWEDCEEDWEDCEEEEEEETNDNLDDASVHWDSLSDLDESNLGPIKQPEPKDFEPLKDLNREFYVQTFFTGMQVIIKMTNVELTPDKPKYQGGEWHIEGQLVSL